MQSVLVHLASFAVMFHMTFGCSWHHGFGTTHACMKDGMANACLHDHETAAKDGDHDHHDHGDSQEHDDGHGHHHDSLPTADVTVGNPGCCDHENGHHGCQDDSCLVTSDAKPVTAPADLIVEYLGGVESDSITEASAYPDSAYDPFPDCTYAATGMRLHLSLCVLTL